MEVSFYVQELDSSYYMNTWDFAYIKAPAAASFYSQINRIKLSITTIDIVLKMKDVYLSNI